MGLSIGIIGRPQSGKTTVFNAVVHGRAETASFRAGGTQPNVGVAKVPDVRLQQLAEISRPRRVVPAEVEYLDVPGVSQDSDHSRGIGGEFLNILQRCDTLALVVRAFNDPAISHVEETIDPFRDVDTMELEMAFSDMGILERREKRIQASMKGAKRTDRGALLKEAELIGQIRQGLEAEVPLREQVLPPDARPVISNFQLLTAKPLLILFNIGEDDLHGLPTLDQELMDRLARPHVEAAGICGKLEMELARMSPEEGAEFRASLRAGESGLDRVVRLSYTVSDWICFLTTGEDETRAWTIPQGATALQAAGKVHSDIQRGFIRAEVMTVDDLIRTRNLAEARRQGVLRSEGKGYVMRDGDLVQFLFNV
jgi:GTP-binding protein YchF